MRRLVLYSTTGCHLCELAEEILDRHQELEVKKIDIANSAKLLEKYGVSIPVVGCMDSERELAWPFTQHDFSIWLEKLF